MDEAAVLSVGGGWEFVCPTCGGHRWGSHIARREDGMYEAVSRTCSTCRFTWPVEDDRKYATWTPYRPRPDEPTRCVCGATADQPLCYCDA